MIREDTNWPRASSWLAGGAKKSGDGASLSVLGVPLNCSAGASQFELAPAAIREALSNYSLHDSDAGIDLGRITVRDFGDVTLVGSSAEGNFFRCVDVMRRAHVGDATILLGGDNSVTRPGVHALGFPLERCGLLTEAMRSRGYGGLLETLSQVGRYIVAGATATLLADIVVMSVYTIGHGRSDGHGHDCSVSAHNTDERGAADQRPRYATGHRTGFAAA